MADYGVNGMGGSLRDALNQLYPMTGLGEYNAMFPPAFGADQPTAPPPMPRPRPPQAPQMPGYLSPAGAVTTGPPATPGAAAGPPPQLPAGLSTDPSGAIVGGASMPIGGGTLSASGRYRSPMDYGMLLRYARGF